MKRFVLFIFFTILLDSCISDEDTRNLQSFIQSFSHDVKNYKVVCIVPVDGCSTCIDPSLNYAKKKHKGFLLVMSSKYKKSIDYAIEKLQFEHINYISDYHNLALKRGLATEIAPCFYFLKKGVVVKKVDLFPIIDKVSILKEVEKFLSER